MAGKIIDSTRGSDGNISAVKIRGNKGFTPVETAIRMVKRGDLPGYNVATSKNGKEYIRANPDNSARNNLGEMADD